MKTAIQQENHAILDTIHYQPAVSIIIPFEPKMSLKTEIDHKLKLACQQAERDLKAAFPDEESQPVIEKLKNLVKDLNYNTHKKSIAIFASPVTEKVYYLDVPVEEKVIVDGSFEIRDLVYSKKEIHKYLLLVLSGERSRIYLGNTTQFVRIASNVPEHAAAYRNDIPERTSNFSDPAYRKEVMLEKFLRHIDNGLGIILNAYNLPLYLMGTDRTIGHFKKITHNLSHINGEVQGNFDNASETELRKAIAPLVADWKKVKENNLLNQINAARSANKLVGGIQEVWQEVAGRKGRLLIVEKNYRCAALQNKQFETIIPAEEAIVSPFYIKDAVDDIIEKVIEYGGDVEFVDEGVLKGYDHIALIKYF